MKTLGSASAACAVLITAALAAPLSSLGAAPLRYKPVSERTFAAGSAADHRGFARPDEASRRDIGSANTVTADPPVARPNETPCVVTLFRDEKFTDFNAKPFAYAPPGACPGPWAKVVLVGNFNVSAGVQFDRTAQVSIGNVNVYYGTTPEPSSNLSPHWHFERDLTDVSALLESAHAGEADLGNLVNSTYTGIITGTTYLQFYPAREHIAAAHTPDVVLPVPNVPGGAQALPTTTSMLSATYAFPGNVERAYLDVFAQSQSSDEFWYTCVPNDVAQALNSCPNTAFRETEISVDGVPAGVAPVYPWIFTGGIDPFLWRPIPGVQTLNFKPYRVDLTPFAGLLDDGKSHTVSLGVYNADNYFLATSTLLLYLDRASRHVAGALTRDTLAAAPTPSVSENIVTSGGFPSGTISVTSGRAYGVEGYVNTSYGHVTTKLEGNVGFRNEQRFVNSATLSVQDINQNTVVEVLTRRTEPRSVTIQDDYRRYPLVADINLAISPQGYAQTTTIRQRFINANARVGTSAPPSFDYVSNRVEATDTLNFDSSFNFLGHHGQMSSQRYVAFGSNGACYQQSITAQNDVLTGVTNGCGTEPDAQLLLRAMQGRIGKLK